MSKKGSKENKDQEAGGEAKEESKELLEDKEGSNH